MPTPMPSPPDPARVPAAHRRRPADVPVWIAGRTYAARVPDDPRGVADRLRSADSRTCGRVALATLGEFFDGDEAARIFARVEDAGDPLDDVALHQALLGACKQAQAVGLRRALTAQITTVSRPGGAYWPVIWIGGHRRELTPDQAREHAAAVMAAVARADWDRRLMRHLVVNMRLTPPAAIALIEREVAAGREPLPHRALAPLRLRPVLDEQGEAFLHVWIPADGRAPQVDERWPLNVARGYAAEVMAVPEAAALHTATEAWLCGPGELAESEANRTVVMLHQQL